MQWRRWFSVLTVVWLDLILWVIADQISIRGYVTEGGVLALVVIGASPLLLWLVVLLEKIAYNKRTDSRG